MDTKVFKAFDSKPFMRFSNPSLIEKDLQTLVGIISGIRSDQVINQTEYTALVEWIQAHKEYETKQPYKDVISIVRQSIADNFLTSEESDNIIWFCNQYIRKTGYYNAITSGIQQLLGIVNGINIDRQLNMGELAFLDQWLEEHEYLRNTWPYDELYSLTTKIIQDKVISKEEQELFMSFCSALINDQEEASNLALIDSLKVGFYQIDPQLTLRRKPFASRTFPKSISVARLPKKLNCMAVSSRQCKCQTRLPGRVRREKHLLGVYLLWKED